MSFFCLVHFLSDRTKDKRDKKYEYKSSCVQIHAATNCLLLTKKGHPLRMAFFTMLLGSLAVQTTSFSSCRRLRLPS